jgi:hypothetical protein
MKVCRLKNGAGRKPTKYRSKNFSRGGDGSSVPKHPSEGQVVSEKAVEGP